MDEKQLLKAIPIYNDIKALEVTANQLKRFFDHPEVLITKCYLTFNDGNGIDLTNFDKDFSKTLMSTFFVYKEKQLKILTDKLQAI